jgi:hypothetical protein
MQHFFNDEVDTIPLPGKKNLVLVPFYFTWSKKVEVKVKVKVT